MKDVFNMFVTHRMFTFKVKTNIQDKFFWSIYMCNLFQSKCFSKNLPTIIIIFIHSSWLLYMIQLHLHNCKHYKTKNISNLKLWIQWNKHVVRCQLPKFLVKEKLDLKCRLDFCTLKSYLLLGCCTVYFQQMSKTLKDLTSILVVHVLLWDMF